MLLVLSTYIGKRRLKGLTVQGKPGDAQELTAAVQLDRDVCQD